MRLFWYILSIGAAFAILRLLRVPLQSKFGNNLRIGIAVAIILGTIGWLAFTGYSSNKSYYVTIAELGGMGDKAYHSQLRVEGFVQPGSIEQNGTHVTFVLNEFESHSPKAATGRTLKVIYKGSEPPPDTFKDDSQALAEGTYRPRRRVPRERAAGQVRQQVRTRAAGRQPGNGRPSSPPPRRRQSAPPANQAAARQTATN